MTVRKVGNKYDIGFGNTMHKTKASADRAEAKALADGWLNKE